MAENDTEQAQEASVEDRIGNMFGGTEAPEPQTEGDETATAQAEGENQEAKQTEPETFEIEVDGQKYTLPKALEKSIMQERDYTQKSQGVADLRRVLEHDQQVQRIANLEQTFTKQVAAQTREIDMLDAVIQQAQAQNWGQLPTDELIRKRMELDALKDRRNALAEEVEGKRSEFQATTARELEQLKQQSLDVIRKRIPGFNDAVQKEVRDAALADGYTDAELSAIFNPKHAITLWKAAQYDKLQRAAKPAVAQARPMKTTPTSQMPKHVQNKLNYQKSLAKAERGTRDRQKLVENRIGEIFG